MASIKGVHVETIRNPRDYTPTQLDLACRVAWIMQRGKLVLVEKPGM